MINAIMQRYFLKLKGNFFDISMGAFRYIKVWAGTTVGKRSWYMSMHMFLHNSKIPPKIFEINVGIFHDHLSCRSRISLRKEANPEGYANLLFGKFFAENCMKMKEIG